MGVERAVTRWYLQRQSILNEIATLEAKLAHLQSQSQEPRSEQTSSSEDEQAELKNTDLLQQLAHVQESLYRLGPCPKPMMG